LVAPVLYKILIKIVQILIKLLPVNSEVLVLSVNDFFDSVNFIEMGTFVSLKTSGHVSYE
jgi:hypothetical protein